MSVCALCTRKATHRVAHTGCADATPYCSHTCHALDCALVGRNLSQNEAYDFNTAESVLKRIIAALDTEPGGAGPGPFPEDEARRVIYSRLMGLIGVMRGMTPDELSRATVEQIRFVAAQWVTAMVHNQAYAQLAGRAPSEAEKQQVNANAQQLVNDLVSKFLPIQTVPPAPPASYSPPNALSNEPALAVTYSEGGSAPGLPSPPANNVPQIEGPPKRVREEAPPAAAAEPARQRPPPPVDIAAVAKNLAANRAAAPSSLNLMRTLAVQQWRNEISFKNYNVPMGTLRDTDNLTPLQTWRLSIISLGKAFLGEGGKLKQLLSKAVTAMRIAKTYSDPDYAGIFLRLYHARLSESELAALSKDPDGQKTYMIAAALNLANEELIALARYYPRALDKKGVTQFIDRILPLAQAHAELVCKRLPVASAVGDGSLLADSEKWTRDVSVELVTIPN